MNVDLRRAEPADAPACIALRGRTRENAVSEARLRDYGVTVESWAAGIADGSWPGWVAVDQGSVVGYGFGARDSGEVLVLVLLPAYEGAGLGRRLLGLVTAELRACGHQRLFLGCATDPLVRSYGFYRRLGWTSTGAFDAHGDEILEMRA